MKAIKLLALMLVAILGLTACSDDKDYQTTTNIYECYVYASFSYAQDYYSGKGEVRVKVENGVYTITVKNEQWGEGTFEDVKVGENITGTGSISTPNDRTGEVKSYEAEISGTLSEFTITAPTLMQGGTTLHFYIGSIPATKMAGTYSGTNSVQVDDNEQWIYTADIDYEITANENGTINITIPEYTLEGTEMGNLTLGSYTISNIRFSQKRGAYYYEYGNDRLQMHFKSEGGRAQIDKNYAFSPSDPVSSITIQPAIKSLRPKVTVVNAFGLGHIDEQSRQFRLDMPFPLTTTFEGSVSSAK